MFINGGGYICYPDIKKSEQILLSDGVHLTDLILVLSQYIFVLNTVTVTIGTSSV